MAGIAAAGCALLAIAHLGITIPVLSRFGPRGDAVPPAVVAFAIGTALFGAIAVGLWQRRRWSFAAGLAVSALAVLSGVAQYRGAVSAVGIVLAVVLAGLLLAPGSRRQFSA